MANQVGLSPTDLRVLLRRARRRGLVLWRGADGITTNYLFAWRVSHYQGTSYGGGGGDRTHVLNLTDNLVSGLTFHTPPYVYYYIKLLCYNYQYVKERKNISTVSHSR